jgi:hypothetical protein
MIFEDYQSIAKRLKHIQEQEMRPEKTQQDLDDEADMGNEEDGNMCYENFIDSYIGCDS